MQLLEKSPYFRASGGSNHFALHSINQMMLYYANEPCLKLYQLCFNCTKLSIDTYSPTIYKFIAENAFMRNKWLSIPFPSNYHLSEASTKPPWRLIAASTGAAQSSSQYIEYSNERPYMFCFVGTDKVTAKLQKQLRIEVRQVCATYSSRSTDPCLLVEMQSHDSNYQQDMLWQRSDHAANISFAFKAENPYRLAKFCFQPGSLQWTCLHRRTHHNLLYCTGGDFPTRKGLLDSLLSGCIPVVFELTAAHEQWPLHWGSKKTTSSCVVYIPRDIAVRNMTEVFAYLTRLSYDRVFMSKKRQAIADIGHRMQYSLPSNQSTVGGELNSYQKDDAFDITLEYVLAQRNSVSVA